MTETDDLPDVLADRGWTQISETPERYVGRFIQNRVEMGGGIKIDGDGRPQVYVRHPTKAFWKNVSEGGQLASPPKTVKAAYRVQFVTAPETIEAAVERIESMMEADDMDGGPGNVAADTDGDDGGEAC